MKYLKKPPNSVREVPGPEWTVLKKFPLTALLGTLFPLVMSLANRVFPLEGTVTQIAKHIKSVHIIAIATVVTVWTAVLTVVLGCFVVMMKGHAYVADGHELMDSERSKSR